MGCMSRLALANHEAGPVVLVHVLLVAQNVADVLAEEALDALPELVQPLDVLLLHPPRAVSSGAGVNAGICSFTR